MQYSPREVHFSTNLIVKWNACKIISARHNKSNDEVTPHEIGSKVFVEIHD